MTSSDNWYALQVAPGKEIEISDLINVDQPRVLAYCPVFWVKKKGSRHAKAVVLDEKPVFSMWLFVSWLVGYPNWSEVTEYRDVHGLLAMGGEPLPIRDRVIQRIRTESDAGVYNEKSVGATWKPGDRVMISDSSSAFFGHSGELLNMKGRSSSIEIMLFGRETVVQAPTELLKKIL